MKLISAQIRNYQHVINSKEFEIENVTCLAGRNIDGKTDTLKALTKLNPADPTDGNFFDQQRQNGSPETLNDKPENVLTTRWILMQDDILAMEAFLGRNCLTDEVVTIRKGYKNELQWEIPINYDSNRQHAPAKLPGRDYKVRFFASDVFSQLIHSLKPSGPHSGQEKLVRTDYQTDGATAKSKGREILEKKLPRFLYAAVHDIISSDSSLADLLAKKPGDNYTPGERILLDFLTLAGTSPEQMLASADPEAIAATLTTLSDTYCRKISQYWPHYSDLAFDIFLTPVVPRTSGGYSVDQHISLRVINWRDGSLESIDESRSGFLWFFSFLIRYHKASSCYNSNLVLVLDEPGLTESTRAQSALLTYFSRELTPRHQIIYSTHLSSMVDATLF